MDGAATTVNKFLSAVPQVSSRPSQNLIIARTNEDERADLQGLIGSPETDSAKATVPRWGQRDVLQPSFILGSVREG